MVDVIVASARSRNFSDGDIEDTVSKAFDLVDCNFCKKVDTVVIKPNLCYYWDYSTGETTDPRVVSAIINCVRANLGEDVEIFVGEADASAMKTKYAFRALGYEEMCRQKNVELINLSEGCLVEKEVAVKNEKLTLQVNRLLLDSDLLINVPKLKSHRVVGITCSLKNMFGAIATPRKFVYHKQLPEAIVGINKLVRSDLVFVDGMIAVGSHPRKLGIIIAGRDALATDLVAAEIMGYNPKRISYLSLAEKELSREDSFVNIIEKGTRINYIKQAFPKRSYLLGKISWRLQLDLLRMYSTIVGDVVPPVLSEQ